jgi:tetratricopeptide (TPR) repeat protein
MSGLTVFISYSHDSPEHSERVLALSERLRDDGITTQVDQYVNGTPSNGWPRWMMDRIDEADSVIVVCTETYYKRFRGHEEPGKGKGADWEGAVITQEIYDARSDTLKFVPIFFLPADEAFIPEPLRPLTHYLLDSEENYNALYDFLLGQAGVEPRPVGKLKAKERRRGVPLTFNEPAKVSDTPPRISPLRLSVTGKKFVGREQELAMLDRAWNSSGNQKINIVSLIGQGGEGKSAIALEWYLRRSRDGWQGARHVFDWSFYSQGTSAQSSASADDFFNAAFEWFGHTGEVPKDPWTKGGKLAEIITAERTLLMLDGLEPLQQPPGDYGGEFKDPAIKAFLRGVGSRNRGLCVLTSRTDITDLADFERTGGSCLRHPLFALDLNTARLLLRELGVEGPDRELDEAIAWFHGHAYDLNLLGNYLAQCTDDHDIRGWQERFPILREDERIHPVPDAAGKRAGHGRRMLRAYERWLGPQSASMGALRLLGLFDRPARSDLLDELRAEPVIEGLTDTLAELPDDEWLRTLNQLQKLGLISREAMSLAPEALITEEANVLSAAEIPDELVDSLLQRDDVPEELRKLSKSELKQLMARSLTAEKKSSANAKRPRRAVAYVVDAHPLLREHFKAELKEQHFDAWQAAHRRLFEYLCDTTPDKEEPTLEDLQPLYQAVAHGCQAGLQQEALDKVCQPRIWRRDEVYTARMLGIFGSDLGAIACFFEKPWSRISAILREPAQAFLLNNAAYCLRALGRLTEALEPIRAALQLSVTRKDWTGAAPTASNLSELELTLGEVAEAMRDAEQSVTYADRSGDAMELLQDITTHADALHQSGRRAEALERYRGAEQMQQERRTAYPLLYSLWGFRYCDLLLAAPERAAWQRMQRSEVRDERSEVSELVEMCRAVSERAAQTLKWVESWQQDVLSAALDHLTLGRAALYEVIVTATSFPLKTKNSKLKTQIDAAVAGLRRSGNIDELPRGLLTRAWLRFLEGASTGSQSAEEDLDEAFEIAERGPMRLFMADIHLYRARLFHAVKPYPWSKFDDGSEGRGPKDDLADARKLIEQCGYWRRKEELEDAEEAAKNW